MSVETLQILEPGLLTTVQDTGRYGYQRFGVPVAGAMDTFALRAANILAGNEENAAALEMTVLGPRVRFLADTWIALTGGDLSPLVDGREVPIWQAVRVREGSVLSFKGPRDGMRSYLAVAGGIDVPVVMGSRSTYVKAAIGGHQGRALKQGDVLHAFGPEPGQDFVARRLPRGVELPWYGHEHEIRVVLGPQDAAFTRQGLDTFLGSAYTISMSSDRMGYRLDGPQIEHTSGADIVSDGTPFGAVQVPGDGHPIILLADRGITGGYTKIATVISTDISRLAQAMPGDTLTFRAVTVDEAHQALRETESLLHSIRELGEATARLSIIVEGEAFEVVDDSGQAVALSQLTEEGARSWSHHARATVEGHTYEFEVKVQQVD